MLKKTLLLLSLLTPIYFMTTSAEAKEVKQYKVKEGQIFKISLPSNPTTGYNWGVRAIPQNLVLLAMGYEQSKDCGPHMVGCSGHSVFTFRALETGKGSVALQYARPFEPQPKEMTLKEVIVKK